MGGRGPFHKSSFLLAQRPFHPKSKQKSFAPLQEGTSTRTPLNGPLETPFKGAEPAVDPILFQKGVSGAHDDSPN